MRDVAATGTRARSCRRCGAALYWAKTRNGRWMPIEPAAEPGPAGNLRVGTNLLGEQTVEVVPQGTGTHRHHVTTCRQEELADA